MTKIWRQKEWEKEIEQNPDKPLEISPGVVINKPKKKKMMMGGGSVRMKPAKQMNSKKYAMNRGGMASLRKPMRSI